MSSNRKYAFSGFGEVDVAAAETSLPTPPVFFGDVSATWNRGKSVPGRFDLEIFAAATVELTNAELLGVVQIQIEIASDDVDTVDFANDELDITTHGLLAGYGPIQLTTTGVLPAGLALLTDYFVIFKTTGTIQLATSLHDAMEGTANAVAFTDAGSGTHSILGSAAMTPFEPESDHSFAKGSNNAFAPILMSYGLLGQAADGAISLTATEGYTTAIEHRPRVVLYGVQATLDVAVATTVSLYPVDDVF